NHVVVGVDAEVPVYIGSEVIKDRRPTVVGVKLKRGAQVVSIGKPQADAEGEYMPIEPPHGEGRFIRAEFVARTAPAAAAGGAGAPSSGVVTAGALQPSKAPSANPPPSPDELYRRAQQYEQIGRIPEAIRLYALAAGSSANPTLAADALQRA